ncbi:MAG: acyl-ACP--UDP-N-acetylglucosamine O-acyltransferase [Deltaproteobacteria bacterium]|nr:acyl-ACP--UDP-N-acetylglucosamine O-acyltransferase [Deltaproteobacteria bacterium]
MRRLSPRSRTERAPDPAAASLHATAVIDPRAELDAGVEVGPFAVVGSRVRIARGTRIGAHAVIEGPTQIGADNRIFPHAVLGGAPQDRRYGGEPTSLVVGARNEIREFVTLNRGTVHGNGTTVIGDGCILMSSSHVAHDCVLGDGVILASGVLLAGHVEVGDHAVFGGLAAVGQMLRVGESAMVAAGAMVERDVPPFHTVSGDRARLRALNLVGLERRGLEPDAIRGLEEAHRMIFRSGVPVQEAILAARERLGHVAEVARLLDFIAASKKGICSRGR